MSKKRKACKYKMYFSENSAWAASRRLWDSRQVAPYKCSFCSGWHLAKNKVKRLNFLFAQLEGQK